MSTEVSLSLATTMSRPHVGIDRLPTRRISNEPREAMNCKSCRKRKIKCNRTRPTCEACQVFDCPCVYDAIPKKRGPKTDVLENLLKRVDGLEKRLVTEGKSDDLVDPNLSLDPSSDAAAVAQGPSQPQPLQTASTHTPVIDHATQLMSPIEPSPQTPSLAPEILVDTYFARIHGKPYYILDETTTRQRLLANQLPNHLAYAIYAVSARYAPHFGGYQSTVQIGEDYARRARQELDIDEPSVETLQTLLLLSLASHQLGKGKKTFMLLTSAISMAVALDLHRELPTTVKFSTPEREGRRRLFWSCYLMDRLAATGCKRPSLIADESIVLRLPSWQLPGGMVVEGDYFPNGCNLQYMSVSGKGGQGSMGMLIGISRVMGITNRYLAAGGVKGDSHFPWHSLSNLSKIRHELDIWASETQNTFTSIETLFNRPESTVLVLSKLMYHLIHCLIYRPFLPVDLAELSGTSQHQPWQIEATNLCFLHANAISEIVEIGSNSLMDWPAFVGYCLCTAGTIHIHGAHYPLREGEVYSVSADYLAREMQQLSELRFIWAGVQHQQDTLQTVYGCHNELVQSLASNPMRYAPVFQLEDFFDRYPSQVFDGSHVTFLDIEVQAAQDGLATYNIEQRNNMYLTTGIIGGTSNYSKRVLPSQHTQYVGSNRPKKRRATTSLPTGSATKKVAHSTPSLSKPTSNTHPSLHGTMEVNNAQSNMSQSGVEAGMSKQPFMIDSPNIPTTGPGLPFSPEFCYSPIPHFASAAPSPVPRSTNTPHHDHAGIHFDPMLSIPTPYDQQPTPGAGSTPGASVHTDPDSKDPFLSLLEQLAENEGNRDGPSELDFFLSGENG